MTTYVKRTHSRTDGYFEVEAAGLRWLAEAGTAGVPVVEVFEVAPDHITLAKLERARATPEMAEDFGVRLAATHDTGAPAFGCPPGDWTGDGFIGTAPMPLRTAETWGQMYAVQRCLPFARTALQAGDLSSSGMRTIEKLCERLGNGDFDDEAPPARIHGDLWSGNAFATPDGFTLIDPAAHGGHRITDLAMLSLFGNPFLERTLAAYADASNRLPDGWRKLIHLHQVHPLLVHAALFGGGYGASAVNAAAAYV